MILHHGEPDLGNRLGLIGDSLQARALGLWHRQGDKLALRLFLGGAELGDDVAAAFCLATQTVDLEQTALSIVQAAREVRHVEAVAERLDPDIGSGLWLRAFNAARSIAVPIPGGVVSIAVGPGCSHPPIRIAELLREACGFPGR